MNINILGSKNHSIGTEVASFRKTSRISISLTMLALFLAVISPALWAEDETAEVDGGRDQNIKLSVDNSEKGSVNGTGVFNTSIPIAMPAGKAGFTPSLSLQYSSESGADIAGQGWGYGMDCITRHSITYSSPAGSEQHTYHMGTPKYDSSDVFLLNGDRLISCINDRGGSCIDGNDGSFRTEIDSFQKIVRNPSSTYEWIAYNSDGSRKEYGGTNATWKNGNYPYRWCVARKFDIANNVIAYSYEDPLFNSPKLQSIKYDPQAQVFLYYDQRPDKRTSYTFGVEEVSDSLLENILVTKNGLTYQLYNLVYDSYPTLVGGGRDNFRSLLTKVEICGTKGDCKDTNTQRYTFEYGRPYQQYWQSEVPEQFEYPIYESYFRFIDINGDGFKDVICKGDMNVIPYSCNYIKYGTGSGELVDGSSPLIKRKADISDIPLFERVVTAQGPQDQGVRAGNITGGRYPDFIESRKESDGTIIRNVYSAIEDDSVNPPLVIYRLNSNFNLSSIPRFIEQTGGSSYDLGYRLIDLNGDGLLDIVKGFINQTTFITEPSGRKAWINTGNSFVDAGSAFTPPFDFIKLVTSSDGEHVSKNLGVFIVDVNGDGLTDMVMAHSYYTDGEPDLMVYLNKGRIQAGSSSVWALSNPYTSSLYSYWPLGAGGQRPPVCFEAYNDLYNKDWGCEFTDVNGDDLPDLVQSAEKDGQLFSHVLLNDGQQWLPANYGSFFAPTVALSKDGSMHGRRSTMEPTLLKSTSDIVKSNYYTLPNVVPPIGYSVIERYESVSNPTGDRLTHIVNPLGGHQFITYGYANDTEKNPDLSAHKVVVTKTCTADGRYYTGPANTYGDACSQPTDILTTYAYRGGEMNGSHGGFSGFRYTREALGDGPYHQVKETWQKTDWCVSGQTLFTLQSSIASGKLDVCGHYNSNDFWFNYSSPQSTVGSCSSADAQILSSAYNAYSSGCADPLIMASQGAPIFRPLISTISAAYEPSSPSQKLSSQKVVEYEAADLNRGRPSKSCTFIDSSTLRTSCSAGTPESAKSTEYADVENHPTVGNWVFDRVCENKTFDRDQQVFQTERSFYGGDSCSVSGSNVANTYYLPVRKEVYDSQGMLGAKSESEYSPDGNVVMQRTYSLDEGGYQKYQTIRKSYYSNDPTLLKCESYLDSGDPCSAGLKISSFVYDQLGRPQIARDEDNGISTTFTYDSQHREIHRQSSVEEAWTNYVNIGNPNLQYSEQISLFDPSSGHKLITRAYVDGLGRTTKTHQSSNMEQEESLESYTYYDSYGRAYRKMEPFFDIAGPSSSYIIDVLYDRFGRPEKEMHNSVLKSRLGHKITGSYRDEFTYIENGSAVNGSGNQLNYMRFDSLGRKIWAGEAMVAGVTDCGGDVPDSTNCTSVQFAYDERGFQNRITLPLVPSISEQPVMQIYHDDMGHNVKTVDPDMSNCSNPEDCPWTYAYDLAGKLTKQTNAAGGVSRIVYDNMGRKIWRVNCAGGNAETLGRYIYDTAYINRLLTEYHVNGSSSPVLDLSDLCGSDSLVLSDGAYEALLSGISDEDIIAQAMVKRVYNYNLNGTLRIKEVSARLPGQAQVVSRERYTYLFNNAAGPLKQIVVTASDGTSDTFDITYNALGREFSKKTQSGVGVLRTIYDAYGRVTTKELGPNQIRLDKTYHQSGHASQRLESINYDMGGLGVYSFDNYNFDNVGNITHYRTSFTGPLKNYSFENNFTYDVQNQLKGFNYTSSPGDPGMSPYGSYTYDALGNRTSVQEIIDGIKTPAPPGGKKPIVPIQVPTELEGRE